MNDSLKISAVLGLIAGFVAGIITVVSLVLVYALGLPHYISPPPHLPFPELAVKEIVLSVIWGVILVFVYLRTYELIPGEGVSKGVVFGMICYLVFNIRTGMLRFFYGVFAAYASSILVGFLTWVVFGLVLGILDKKLREGHVTLKMKPETKRYDLKGGIHPGAIAGLSGGIVVPITWFAGIAVGIWPPAIPHPDISFMLSQVGTHALFNMVWGIVFGILFVKSYNIIPYRGASKGIVFGLVIFLITSLRVAVHYFAYGDLPDFEVWAVTGFLNFLVFGLVLGALYKK